jgi:lipopolysaccharide transport protein LptA
VKKINFILITLISILALNVNAQEDQDASVDITSDSLEITRASGSAQFTGNVKTLYKDMTLTSDSLKISYDDKTKTKNKINKIIAIGNVVLEQGNDTVVAGYAEYFVKDNNIIFDKNVVLNRNGNVLEGDHLVMNTVTKKAKMSSNGDKRVKAIYFKEPKKTNEESLINE